jgi:hypothetical protein
MEEEAMTGVAKDSPGTGPRGQGASAASLASALAPRAEPGGGRSQSLSQHQNDMLIQLSAIQVTIHIDPR